MDSLVGEGGGAACPFCDISRLRTSDLFIASGSCVYTSNSWGSWPQETLPGSGIIVPLAHRRSPFELTAQEWNSTAELVAEVKETIDSRLQPDGYTIGWNVGRVAGQEVEHVHLHIVPRFAAEKFAGRGLRWWLKQPENRVRVRSQP